jgi:hypothetical protein
MAYSIAPPRSTVPILRILAIALAVIGILGFFSTLLPIFTSTIDGADIGSSFDTDFSDDDLDMVKSSELTISLGFYDWNSAGLLAAAAAPFALVISSVIGAAQAIRGGTKSLMGGAAAVSIIALALAVVTALRSPVTSVEFDLADSPFEVSDTASAGSLDPGLGLIFVLIALTLTSALAIWGYFTAPEATQPL